MENFIMHTVGIDFSNDYTQVSIFDDDVEPVSLSVIKNEQRYLIPSVAFVDETTGLWYIGDDALNRKATSDGKLIENLPEVVMSGEAVEIFGEDVYGDSIVAAFMDKLLEVIIQNSEIEKVTNVVITIDSTEKKFFQIIYNAFEKLDFKSNQIRVISHDESFGYYVMSQKQDIWVNSVMMLNFNGDELVERTLYSNSKRGPHIVTVTKNIVPGISKELVNSKEKEKADAIFANYLREEFRGSVYSAIFMIGEEFNDERWHKQSMALMCNNRRVFKGHNLLVKGAGYAAREMFGESSIDTVFLCKGRTPIDIGLMVMHDGRERQLIMSKAGTNWYDAGAKVECIVDHCNAAKIALTNPLTKITNYLFINIDELPKRPNKTTRLEITLSYKTENEVVITIEDMGFGEFFEASGMVIRKEIKVKEYL